MSLLDQSALDRLIGCSKEISDPPARELKLSGAHWRNDARLIASDGSKGVFLMFMRKNEDFPENFSIGLTYSPNDGNPEVMLLRCNGKHGEFNGGYNPDHPHYTYHIHRANENSIKAGLSSIKYAETTDRYASYEEALEYFIKTINLSVGDAIKHFPSVRQGDLFEY